MDILLWLVIGLLGEGSIWYDALKVFQKDITAVISDYRDMILYEFRQSK